MFSSNLLSSSELIVTPDGRIYHLNLHPQQLAPTVITVGDPSRVEEVSKYFDSIEHKVAHREFITHTGRLGNKNLSVISTGIGPDNIDIVLNELDALVNIDLQNRQTKEVNSNLQIIRLGTSGSLQEDIPVDSLVVSSFGMGLDNLMHYYPSEPNPEELYIHNDFLQHSGLQPSLINPYIAEGSIHLRNIFTKEGWHHGITVTCPGFYGPQGRSLRGGLRFPNLIDSLSTFKSRGHRITNFEMETSALYGLGNLLGHQCLSVSAIIANRVKKTFSVQPQQVIDKMIQSALQIICSS